MEGNTYCNNTTPIPPLLEKCQLTAESEDKGGTGFESEGVNQERKVLNEGQGGNCVALQNGRENLHSRSENGISERKIIPQTRRSQK